MAKISVIAAVLVLLFSRWCQGELLEFTYWPPGTYETSAIENVLVQSYPNYVRLTPKFSPISDVRRDMTIMACFEDRGCDTHRLHLLALSGAVTPVEFKFIPAFPVFITFHGYSSQLDRWINSTYDYNMLFEDWEEKYPNPYSNCHATVSENQYTLSWHHDIHSEYYTMASVYKEIYGEGNWLDGNITSKPGLNSYTFARKEQMPSVTYHFKLKAYARGRNWVHSTTGCEFETHVNATVIDPPKVSKLHVARSSSDRFALNLTWILPPNGAGWDGFAITCMTEDEYTGLCPKDEVELPFQNNEGAGMLYSYEYGGVLEGIPYRFSIVATNSYLTGNETVSDWVTLDVLPVTNVTVSQVADTHTTVDMSWQLPERGDGWYKFVISCHSEIEGSEYCPAQVQGTFPYKSGTNGWQSVKLKGLNPGMSYTFSIQTTNGVSKSAIATSNLLTLLPQSPFNLKATLHGRDIAVTWSMESLNTFDHFLLVMRDACGNRTESFELQTDQRRSTHTRPWLSETAFHIWAVSKGLQSPTISPLTVIIGEMPECMVKGKLHGQLSLRDGTIVERYMENGTYDIVCKPGYEPNEQGTTACIGGSLTPSPQCTAIQYCYYPPNLQGRVTNPDGSQASVFEQGREYKLKCNDGYISDVEGKYMSCTTSGFSETLLCNEKFRKSFIAMIVFSAIFFCLAIPLLIYSAVVQYKRNYKKLSLWRIRSSSSVRPSATNYTRKTSSRSSRGGKGDASRPEIATLSSQQADDVEAMELIDFDTGRPTDSNESEIQPVRETRSKDSILKSNLSVTSSKKEVKFSLPGGDSGSRRGSDGSNAPNEQVVAEVHRDGTENEQAEAVQHVDETPKEAEVEEQAVESEPISEGRRASDAVADPTVETSTPAESAESGLERVDLLSSVDPPLPGALSDLSDVTYMTLPTPTVSSIGETKVISPRGSKGPE